MTAKGIRRLRDLVEAGRKSNLTFASAGVGSATHLNAEKFRLQAGIDAVHVPFKGTPEAISDVIGGRNDWFFAPLASADGELDCRGFWTTDKEHPDKDAKFTSNADKCPTLRDYVAGTGVNFGRMRIIKLQPQDREQAIRSIHRDDNNRFNPENEGWVVRSWLELTHSPDSYMLLMDNGPDGLPDPSTERRVPLPKGARFVVDTQRLWHVVVHNHNHPRYALITSFESGPALDSFITRERA